MTKTFATLGVLALAFSFSPSATLADKAPPDVTLSGRTSPVLAVAVSPDGAKVASVADDGKLTVWDVAGKKEAFTVGGAKGNRNQPRFTPDGKTVVALGADNNVLVVDVAAAKAAKPIALPNSAGGAVALDLSPDGKTIAVAGRGAVRLVDLATGAVKATHEVHKDHEVSAVAYSPDGARLATAASDNSAVVLEAATGKVVATADLKAKGKAVSFSADGKTVFTVGDDRALRSFAADAGGPAKPLVERGVAVLTVSATRDGKSLILGGGGRYGPWLLTLADGSISESAFDCEDRVMAAATSPDGKWVAGGGHEGAVYLWKVGG